MLPARQYGTVSKTMYNYAPVGNDYSFGVRDIPYVDAMLGTMIDQATYPTVAPFSRAAPSSRAEREVSSGRRSGLGSRLSNIPISTQLRYLRAHPVKARIAPTDGGKGFLGYEVKS
jgi:hypothetical protein